MLGCAPASTRSRAQCRCPRAAATYRHFASCAMPPACWWCCWSSAASSCCKRDTSSRSTADTSLPSRHNTLRPHEHAGTAQRASCHWSLQCKARFYQQQHSQTWRYKKQRTQFHEHKQTLLINTQTNSKSYSRMLVEGKQAVRLGGRHNMPRPCVPNLKIVAIPVCEILRGSQNFEIGSRAAGDAQFRANLWSGARTAHGLCACQIWRS